MLEQLMQRYRQLSSEFQHVLAWALSNLTRHHDPPVSAEVATRIVQCMMLVMPYAEETPLRDCFWGIAYLTNTNDALLTIIAQSPLVAFLVSTIECQKPALVTPVLRALGNLVAGPNECTQVSKQTS